jgi:hypothetical protein
MIVSSDGQAQPRASLKVWWPECVVVARIESVVMGPLLPFNHPFKVELGN